MSSDDDKKKKKLQLDPETAAVFKKKGYEVKNFLSNGAFGDVYEGEVKETKQRVAIKVSIFLVEFKVYKNLFNFFSA